MYYVFADGVNLPKHWSDMHSTKPCTLIKLDEENPEYKAVQKNFSKDAGVPVQQIFSVSTVNDIAL